MPIRPSPAPDSPTALEGLAALLLGPAAVQVALPPTSELLGALVGLAEGRHVKALLPVAASPAELVLQRRGEHLAVSYLRRDPELAVPVLDRPVPIDDVLREATREARRAAFSIADPSARDLLLRLADRAEQGAVDTGLAPGRVDVSGGVIEPPRAPLAFGYEASIFSGTAEPRSPTEHADLHALLFPGTLWAWVRGRRVVLVHGPIVLAVQRMVAAVRALLEAWDRGRGMHVRLRTGSFLVGLRHRSDDPRGVELTLRSEEAGVITLPGLRPAEAGLPILRVASELTRVLIDADRSQARNLRVADLQGETRELRRRLRRRAERGRSVVHRDPERLRASSPPPEPAVERSTPAPARTLRFEERFRVGLDGLDARSTFLCGDRLVIATPEETVAIDRDRGAALWRRRHTPATTIMAGRTLVRLAADGGVELCDVTDGEARAQLQTAPRRRGPVALSVGGRSHPPVLVLTESPDRIVGIDLRTAELRWRARASGARVAWSRAGRLVLLVAEGVLEALDGASGELLWRLAGRSLQPTAPVVVGETVAVLGGDGARAADRLYGVDLYSGRPRWERRLEGASTGDLVPAGSGLLAAYQEGGRTRLLAVEGADGEVRWDRPDPGLGTGASALPVDDRLLLHGPNGRLDCLGLDDGLERWGRRLAHPLEDDLPHRLEPVLRGGALFVPSAQVRPVRPVDGTDLGDPIPAEVIPDWMRVDERGWVYVAEDGGPLVGLAPRPHLRLLSS